MGPDAADEDARKGATEKEREKGAKRDLCDPSRERCRKLVEKVGDGTSQT